VKRATALEISEAINPTKAASQVSPGLMPHYKSVSVRGSHHRVIADKLFPPRGDALSDTRAAENIQPLY
jgi:hypothetical protein